ncbi:transcription elongation factor [Oleiphilus messinensis]|uniref:Transcription elongation factor n=1 Tax=Oleiphilus messinensis TaxID=141451 RepID=A0A1Y0II34_9GAMM|nr:GreA/GreB family elongation factor [Oleiphilus messinensis]ARU59054.1 transcription elongation factor [Oleiphilus messinensis]
MNKESIILQIAVHLRNELQTVTDAANEARNTATHEESVPENKYDTFALEASYLADGLSRRVAELKSALGAYENTRFPDFTDRPIAIGAMIRVGALDTDETRLYFLGSAGGGIKVDAEGELCQVLTATSPVGQKLLGLECGDEFQITLGAGPIEWEVLDVL